MMHLTCTNMEVRIIDEVLLKCKEAGIRNILALRGDPPAGQDWKKIEGGFSNAVDLVKYIRSCYGDYFCIGVAGYPEGHVDCKGILADTINGAIHLNLRYIRIGDLELDIQHLKAKVAAGADLIVTQLFYSTDLFVDFVKRCRSADITVPIFPGIMPIQSYAGFKRMTELCKTFVPEALSSALEAVKDDPDQVRAFGIQLATDMCRQIQEQCGPKKMGKEGVFGLHFYTLNSEVAVLEILKRLGLTEEEESEVPSPSAETPITVFTNIA